MANSSNPRMKQILRSAVFNLVLILLGAAIMLYPVVATLLNNNRLITISTAYENLVKKVEPDSRKAKLIKEAEEYNAELAKEGHPPRKEDVSDKEYQRYEKILSAPELNGMMAKLVIPSIGVKLPVYHGTSADVLQKGVGHIYGSDLPVGGLGSNVVLSAHTGMVDATMFDNLPNLKNGDLVVLQVLDHEYAYKIDGRQVVPPEAVSAITYDPSKELLTLITCTPYGINTDRLLVFGHRVYPLPKEVTSKKYDASPGIQLQWWMWIDLIFLLGMILFWIWPWLRRRQKPQIPPMPIPPFGKNWLTNHQA